MKIRLQPVQPVLVPKAQQFALAYAIVLHVAERTLHAPKAVFQQLLRRKHDWDIALCTVLILHLVVLSAAVARRAEREPLVGDKGADVMM